MQSTYLLLMNPTNFAGTQNKATKGDEQLPL